MKIKKSNFVKKIHQGHNRGQFVLDEFSCGGAGIRTLVLLIVKMNDYTFIPLILNGQISWFLF